MGLLTDIVGIFVYIIFFTLSCLKGFLILGSVFIFKGPKWMFKRTERNTRPECMNDPTLGTHKTVRVKGLNFHLVVSGDPKNPLMIFLHGFPESWYCWRHQIREFNKDYYVVAPDLRGAGETDAPLGVKHYVIDELTSDVSELVKVLGYSSCTVVGHDWGGMVAWCFTAQYPELVEQLINLNIPHPDNFKRVISSSFTQLRMSWYMAFFQLPWFPEVLMGLNDFKGVAKGAEIGPYTQEDVEAFIYSISRPGRLTSFLNYYRANMSPRSYSDPKFPRISCPILLIWGTGDVALGTELSYGNEKYVDDITVERIEGGNHFIQEEQPKLVNEIIRKYLSKK